VGLEEQSSRFDPLSQGDLTSGCDSKVQGESRNWIRDTGVTFFDYTHGTHLTSASNVKYQKCDDKVKFQKCLGTISKYMINIRDDSS
jgi:hypothetical protein